MSTRQQALADAIARATTEQSFAQPDLVLGVPGGAPGTADTVVTMARMLPAGATWSATGVLVPNPHAVVFVDELADAGDLLATFAEPGVYNATRQFGAVLGAAAIAVLMVIVDMWPLF